MERHDVAVMLALENSASPDIEGKQVSGHVSWANYLRRKALWIQLVAQMKIQGNRIYISGLTLCRAHSILHSFV